MAHFNQKAHLASETIAPDIQHRHATRLEKARCTTLRNHRSKSLTPFCKRITILIFSSPKESPLSPEGQATASARVERYDRALGETKIEERP